MNVNISAASMTVEKFTETW